MASSSPTDQKMPGGLSFRALLRSEVGSLLALLRWWPFWVVLALFVASILAANQVPHTYSVDVGSPQDEAYVRNFHTRLVETGTSYRWSDVYGYVVFPGLGGTRPFTATVTLDPGRSAPVQILVNGVRMFSGNLNAGWTTIAAHVDGSKPQALQSRDTVIELRSIDYRTDDAPTEPKGVKIDRVTVEQAAQGGFIVPALAPLVWLTVAVALLYIAFGRALIGGATLSRARIWALLIVLAGAVGLVAVFAATHVAVAADAPHIAITIITALLIAILCEAVLRNKARSMTAVQCRLLATIFASAYLVRYAGMALPQAVIIDMPYHMKWLTTLLTGDWQSLYFPGGLSEVPREWGMAILIPKSPLFYAAFAPLALVPFDLATSVKWLICLLDASVTLAVFRLLMYVQPRVRAALAGAGLYAIMPLAFRALSYGILPTIVAQWLAALLILMMVAVGVRRWRVAEWAAMVLLALLVFLSFPTVALFASMIIAGYALCIALWRRREGGAMLGTRLGVVLLAGWLLATWAYYGLYISPVLASAQALLAPRTGQAATVRWPGGFGDLVASTADYLVTVLPIILAALGFALLCFVRRLSPERQRALLLVVLWAAIGPLFVLVNYKVDMIGKHLFFTMMPVALAGGVALVRLAGRGRWGTTLSALAFVLIAVQGTGFWIERILGSSS